MKKLLTLTLFLCNTLFCFSQSIFNDKINILTTGTYNVNAIIYTPTNYDPNKLYPLVLFFHGMGEAGTDINLLYNTGLPQVLRSGYKPPFDFIMIAPQRSSYSPDPAWLPGILQDAQRRFPIDTTRMYVTGLSAGGWSSYGSQLNISTTVAKKFAAIVINSGATQDAKTTNFDWWGDSKTPLWATVGNDDVSYRDRNINMVNEVNKRVPNLASITVRQGVGHGGWNDVYNGTVKKNGLDMWQWMYQYTREGGTVVNATERVASILPVHFKSVKATNVGNNQVKIEFEVTDVDTKEFWINLSNDGKTFKRLVKINPDPQNPNKTYSAIVNLNP